MTKETTPSFDFTKPVFTRSGEPVTIITAEGRSLVFPIVGYIGDARIFSMWTENGQFLPDTLDDPRDLVQPVAVYLNVYPSGFGSPAASRALANKSASNSRIACIKVQYTVGQFDD